MNEPMTLTAILEAGEAEQKRMDEVFQHNPRNRTLTIDAAYPYEVDLDRIQTPADLLEWVHHLAGKNWMSAPLLGEFIERTYAIKGWKRSCC